MSRFTPTEGEMHAMVLAANERAERLAQRILAAEDAIKRNQPSSVVLSLLGSDPEPVVLPDGCVDGHSPDLVSCELGVDWP